MKINEIFYSLQGEGRYTGTPAVFVRFSGCNLKCDFCDTLHQESKDMTEDEICEAVGREKGIHVVLTGGEPSLQLTASLIDKLHDIGKFVAVETNGTKELPQNVDWVTCSPKYKPIINQRVNELKVVYQWQDMSQYDGIDAEEYYLQPCDYKDEQKNKENIESVINFIKQHPKWKLSIQTQKILNVQ